MSLAIILNFQFQSYLIAAQLAFSILHIRRIRQEFIYTGIYDGNKNCNYVPFLSLSFGSYFLLLLNNYYVKISAVRQ